MASVIRYLKKKIKPFKRCVTNPSHISFDRQQSSITQQKSLDDNYIINYDCQENAIDATLTQDDVNHQNSANNFYTRNMNGYYNTTNDVDDGYRMAETQALNKHMLHESTPFFNTNKYVANNLNSELKHALQETIEFDDGSMATKLSSIKSNNKINLKRCNNNNISNSNVKTSTLMNGTYTVGNNKLKPKSNSVKSSRKGGYKFFLKRRQSSAACKKNCEDKKDHEKLKLPEPHEAPKPLAILNIETDCENISNTSSTHSDSLCDPLFSSTLKSSSILNYDDSQSLRLENFTDENKLIESEQPSVGMATVTLSKTAFKKYLNKNQDSVNQYANVINNVNTQENILFESSIEKMRRSISLPGINDQLSPIIANLSKISTIKGSEEIEFPTSLNTNSDTFDANLLSILNGDNTESGILKTIEELSRSKDLVKMFEKMRNMDGKQILRTKSLVDYQHEEEETPKRQPQKDKNDEYEAKFIRGNGIRMSKTIKQMFKNVVKYQMNALNCLEKFYEAQVLKLETDRRRDLTLNPLCRDYIIKFYNLQLQQLEERVYSNLNYICRNRCNNCNTAGNSSNCNGHHHNNSQNNVLLNNSKMAKMAQIIIQQQQQQKQQQKFSFESDDGNQFNNNFKRQFSLPYHCKRPSVYINTQLPPQPPNHAIRLQMQKNYEERQAARKNGKFTKQASNVTSSNDLLKKYPQKRQHLNANNYSSNEMLNNSISNQTKTDTLTRRQIKSASSLHAIQAQENAMLPPIASSSSKQSFSFIKKQNKMLTNGSLTVAKNSLSKQASSSYLMNSIEKNNDFSSSSSLFLADNNVNNNHHRLSDSFQNLKFADQFFQPITSSPTQTRRHTHGADTKYFNFKNSIHRNLDLHENDDEDIENELANIGNTINNNKKRCALKETQV